MLVLNATFVNTLLEAYKFRVFWGSPVDAENINYVFFQNNTIIIVFFQQSVYKSK